MELKYTVVKIEIPDDLGGLVIENKKIITTLESLFCAEEAIELRNKYSKDDISNHYWYEVVVDYVEQRFNWNPK